MKEKIFIRTFGCSLNQSDSEQMAGLLTKAGFTITQKIEDADLIIFNSCTVKSPAENALFKELKRWKDKHLVIAGCIPQTDKNKLKEYSLIGTKNFHQITEVVQETLKGNIIQLLTLRGNPELTLPHIRKNKNIGIIPISRGCLGSCTFCKTKAARGNLYSYHPQEIVSLAKEYLADGVNELWLTSQDCGCYGFDIKTDLAELLKRLTKNAQYCAKYRAFAVREPRTISILETEHQPKDYCDEKIVYLGIIMFYLLNFLSKKQWAAACQKSRISEHVKKLLFLEHYQESWILEAPKNF